jgi:predicted CoA-binding protein
MIISDDPEAIRRVLLGSKTIAVVGCSNKPDRDSYQIAASLIDRGFDVIPVNPGATEILGRKCYPDVKSIPKKVDIVDVFRAPEHIPPIADDAIAAKAECLWLQSGIVNDAAPRRRATRASTSFRTAASPRCCGPSSASNGSTCRPGGRGRSLRRSRPSSSRRRTLISREGTRKSPVPFASSFTRQLRDVRASRRRLLVVLSVDVLPSRGRRSEVVGLEASGPFASAFASSASLSSAAGAPLGPLLRVGLFSPSRANIVRLFPDVLQMPLLDLEGHEGNAQFALGGIPDGERVRRRASRRPCGDGPLDGCALEQQSGDGDQHHPHGHTLLKRSMTAFCSNCSRRYATVTSLQR